MFNVATVLWRLKSSNGYGKMGSLNASKSNINSRYASVIEQSALKAGDDGFNVNVANNTDLKGGAITSTQTALDNHKNTFTTDGRCCCINPRVVSYRYDKKIPYPKLARI